MSHFWYRVRYVYYLWRFGAHRGMTLRLAAKWGDSFGWFDNDPREDALSELSYVGEE